MTKTNCWSVHCRYCTESDYIKVIVAGLNAGIRPCEDTILSRVRVTSCEVGTPTYVGALAHGFYFPAGSQWCDGSYGTNSPASCCQPYPVCPSAWRETLPNVVLKSSAFLQRLGEQLFHTSLFGEKTHSRAYTRSLDAHSPTLSLCGVVAGRSAQYVWRRTIGIAPNTHDNVSILLAWFGGQFEARFFTK